MTREFHTFEYQITNQPFAHKELVLSQQSVVLNLLDNSHNLLETANLAYIEAETIYLQIDKKEPIKLENAWVNDFDLADYRNSRNLSTDASIEMPSLHISNSFLFNLSGINFSRALFKENSVFKNVSFLNETSFENASFAKEMHFEYALFFSGKVNFNELSCGKGDKSFKSAVFKGTGYSFEKAKWGDGDINFVNVEFGDGDVNMSFNTFGTGKKIFKLARFGNGRKDFSNTHFGSGIISFEKSDFGTGTLNYRNTDFGDCEVDFTSAHFCNLSFINSRFGKNDVSFKNAGFYGSKNIFRSVVFDSGKKDFHYAKFEKGDFEFENVKFGEGLLDFRATEIKSARLIFDRCSFQNADINFEASEAHSSSLIAHDCTFDGGQVNFEALRFTDSELVIRGIQLKTDKVSFRQSTFRKLTIHSCEMYKYVDLRVSKCHELHITDSLVDGILDLQPESGPLNVEVIDFSGMRLLGRIYIDWYQAHLKRNINLQHTDYRNKAEQFRMLKENYNQLGKYDEEDLAYLEFKRNEAKALLLDAKESGSKFKYWVSKSNYAFKWMVFDKMGHYATDPVRVFQSMFIVYIIFSFIYIFTHYLIPSADIRSSLFPMDDPRVLDETARAFYHSIVTFLTIGYGDYYPTGVSRILSGIEGFTGLFLLSYFTVAFVRKILR